MSIKLMTLAWTIDLSLPEKMVLLALADAANDEGLCWPSVSALCKKCSMAERTIRKVFAQLVGLGQVTIHERAGRSNYFTVHPCIPCTPARHTPLHDVHPTPAPDAPPPLHVVQDTPACGAPINVIEPKVEPKGNRQRARGAGKGSRETETPEWFLDFKLAYPERNGDPNWRGALRAANARMAEGHTAAEFLAGARRYAAHAEAAGKVGTEFIQQASRFLGPDKPFLLPWKPPPRAETASERILRGLNDDNSRVIEHEPERTTALAIPRQ